MWKINKLDSSKQNTTFRVRENDSVMSNRDYLELLINSNTFRQFYNDFLSSTEYDAFFWENKPMMENNLDDEYECNIVNSDFLAAVSPDAETFRQYFDVSKNVVTFPNLANDAELIVPCPKKDNASYTHIGNFVRNADETQIDDLWRITGIETLQSIDSKPKWLSTSGLGVFWLHIRIDTIPKYYQTTKYKTI